MKAEITPKFIKVYPTPTKFIKDGLKIYFSEAQNYYSEPMATADLNKGQSEYNFPPDLIGQIIKAEIVNFNTK